MNKSRASSAVVDLLEVDDKTVHVVLGIRLDLCGIQGDDMVADDRGALVGEIRVVDAQVGVEPRDLAMDQRGRNKALGGDFCLDERLLCGLAREHRGGISWQVLDEVVGAAVVGGRARARDLECGWH
jgi:hypothetical protein